MDSYIGVTGFVARDEVLAVLSVVPPDGPKLMVGVLVNSKTVYGEPNSKHRYPPKIDVGNIFVDDPRVLNLVHFNTRQISFYYEMLGAYILAGEHCHGFQLNIAWPDVGTLSSWRISEPTAIVVLQIGGTAFYMVGNDHQRLADKIEREYKGLIDYVLFDLSGGEGRLLNVSVCTKSLRALFERDLPIGLGVAGGLSPSMLPLVAPLLREFPGLSINAESGLRNGDDHLVIHRATDYYTQGARLMSSQY